MGVTEATRVATHCEEMHLHLQPSNVGKLMLTKLIRVAAADFSSYSSSTNEYWEGSGGTDINTNSPISQGDDSSEQLAMEEFNISLMLVIVASTITSLMLMLTFGAFMYAKTRKQPFNKSFIHFSGAENDESMLYMVDYDEVSIQHGKLQLSVPDGGYEDNSLI